MHFRAPLLTAPSTLTRSARSSPQSRDGGSATASRAPRASMGGEGALKPQMSTGPREPAAPHSSTNTDVPRGARPAPGRSVVCRTSCGGGVRSEPCWHVGPLVACGPHHKRRSIVLASGCHCAGAQLLAQAHPHIDTLVRHAHACTSSPAPGRGTHVPPGTVRLARCVGRRVTPAAAARWRRRRAQRRASSARQSTRWPQRTGLSPPPAVAIGCVWVGWLQEEQAWGRAAERLSCSKCQQGLHAAHQLNIAGWQLRLDPAAHPPEPPHLLEVPPGRGAAAVVPHHTRRQLRPQVGALQVEPVGRAPGKRPRRCAAQGAAAAGCAGRGDELQVGLGVGAGPALV